MRDSPTLHRAQAIAAAAHHGTFRVGGEAYINHPRRVAQALHDAGFNDDTVAAGWLHDVVEDSGWTLAALRAELFAPAVIAAVDSVTRRPGETYMAMIGRAAENQMGTVVKLADNYDNTDPHSTRNLPYATRVSRSVRYRKARTVLHAALFSAPVGRLSAAH